MKKAKIMLTALAAIAVVGGALAFKVQKAFNGSLMCSTVANDCTVKTYSHEPANPSTTLFCTPLGGDPADCPDQFGVLLNP